MALGIFEINDAGIKVAIDNEVVAVSPGYAVLDGEKLLIGQAGMDNARLLPRWTNNRFWNQLGTEAMANRTPTIRHHADLAFAHLESLWHTVRESVQQVIFVVPEFYSREQLGLLLGMAQECDIPVTGMVDTSVVSVAGQPLSATALHLEIYLHRITLTMLTADTRLACMENVTVSETGIFTLWDRWANIIANQFIQASRYDPMHQAVSEQKLYDQLPGWIRDLGNNRGNRFDIELSDVSHSVSVSSEQLMTACANIYPQIVQSIRSRTTPGETLRVFISDRFRGLPGFNDSLQLINHVDLVWLDSEQAVKGVMEHADNIISDSGSVSHVTSLPIEGNATTRTRTRGPAGQPTHLLFGHHATAIGSSFKMGRAFEDGLMEDPDDPVCTIYRRANRIMLDVHDTDSVTINGKPVDSDVTLSAGDTLTIGDRDIVLISVDYNGG